MRGAELLEHKQNEKPFCIRKLLLLTNINCFHFLRLRENKYTKPTIYIQKKNYDFF